MGKDDIKIEDAAELQVETDENQSDSPFLALDIQRLTSARRQLSCDLFIRISDTKMTRVFSVDSGLDYRRLQQYIDKGVTEIFVRREDWDKFKAYLAQNPAQVLDAADAGKVDQVKALIDLADQSVTDFFNSVYVKDATIEQTRKIISKMIQSLSQDPSVLAAILRLVQHHDKMLEHSINVSIVAMLLAKAAKNSTERTLEICGLGGFLHDIGKSQISKDITMNYDGLTPQQWKEMRHHPKLGVRMLEKCANVSEEVRLVVAQHHEQPGGGGYPDGLRGPKIFYPAKIVAIADAFAAMISSDGRKRTYTPEQAIAEMQSEAGKYDKELLQIAAGLFKNMRGQSEAA